MQKRLVINSSAIETRVALLEGSSLAELHVERAGGRSVVGNIYKGRVLRVLPGMQAAFVDIGLEKAAFMHVSDFWPRPADEAAADEDGAEPVAEFEDSLLAYVDDLEVGDVGRGDAGGDEAGSVVEREAAEDDASDQGEDAETGVDAASWALGLGGDAEPESGGEGRGRPARPASIEEALRKGQEILVQISKEPIGSKGARITSHISLPGRYVVYMPTTDHIGVSRRIEDEAERRRLRDIVAAGRPAEAGGFIVRTACEGVSKREILADMRFLSRLWARIRAHSASAPAPQLLHGDLDIVLRAIRDLFTSEVSQVVVDRPEDHRRILEFMEGVLQPKLKSRVLLHPGPEPIFDAFGIEAQVQRALERRVWLKSGGYLVFDQTEALTTIDVNTGRFVGKRTHEETVLKTNVEAARVAIDQLRLRNIGGIIIIDFIDMEDPENRQKVTDVLAEAVKRDKARTNILQISELGLVQMTRKRTRDNLRQLLTTPCPTCRGDGRIRSVESVAAEILRAARRRAAAGDAAALRARTSPAVADALVGDLLPGIEELEQDLGVRLAIVAESSLAREQYEIDVVSHRKPEAPSRAAASAGPARRRPPKDA